MAGIQTNRSAIDLPTEVSSEIIQKAQESSAVMKLAQSMRLPGRGLTIPIIASDPEAEWVDETGKKPVGTPTFDKKIMQAYKLAVIEPFSDEFKRDMRALYDACIERLPNILAKKFDESVFGASAAPGANFDTLAGATAQDISGNNTYAGLVAADGDIAAHDGILNGFALSPQAKAILLSATDGNLRPLFVNNVADGAIPMILGARTHMSRGAYVAGSPNVVGFAGDWTKAFYGVVEGVSITFSDQATLEIGGQMVNLWQHNMFAVKAEMEVGFRADVTVFNKLTA